MVLFTQLSLDHNDDNKSENSFKKTDNQSALAYVTASNMRRTINWSNGATITYALFEICYVTWCLQTNDYDFGKKVYSYEYICRLINFQTHNSPR